MNLQQLTTFCTVLSEGSMTAAADKLFLTQPAVSQQIRSLEEEMGVALLVRGLRNVKPTMQGQLLFDYAKKILHLTQQAEIAIHTMSQEVSGNIRIGTINSLGMYLISPMIGLILKHNSNLNMKLTYGAAEDIIRQMRNDNIDLAILPDLKTEYGIELDKFETRFLMKDEMWLVISSKDTGVPSVAEIRQYTSKPVVVFSDMYIGFKKMLEKKLNESKLAVQSVFESDNVGTCKRVIESGLGWGYMPAHSIRKQVRMNRLNHVQIDELKYSVNINLYARRSEKSNAIVEVINRALQQQALNN